MPFPPDLHLCSGRWHGPGGPTGEKSERDSAGLMGQPRLMERALAGKLRGSGWGLSLRFLASYVGITAPHAFAILS